MTHTRPSSRRQAELDAWLLRAAGEGVVDLASMRGTMRAPTNLLQQLAEAVLDSSVSILPEGGLSALRASWASYETQSRGRNIDHDGGMTVVADPLAACAAVVLGLVSPGRHVAVLEPVPPQVVDVVRRVGAMARTVSMRPTEWEFDPAEFASRVGPQTDLIVVADPNPYSGQYLPDDARAAIIAAVEQTGCFVLVDESARHSVVEEEAPETSEFFATLGARCIRVDVPAAGVLAQAASAACIVGAPELIGPIRSAASAFGLGASVIAQSVLARRFSDGAAIDDAATLNGLVASGRALMLDGLDDIGLLGLGGPGGWYVPVRAKALYDGPHDIGDALASQAGLGGLPLAPFYVEGSSDPYVLFAYLRDASVLENSLLRLADFCDGQDVGFSGLALPAPDDWGDEDDNNFEVDEDDLDDSELEDSETYASEFDAITRNGQDSAVEEAVRDEPGSSLEPPKPEFDAQPEDNLVAEVPAEPEETEHNFADDDARYRAAIAELSSVRPDELAHPKEFDQDAPGDDESTNSQSDDGDQPVVLPFGRVRRRGRDSEDTQEEPSVLADTEDEAEASVFKFSVPDIASPNIATPATTSDGEVFVPSTKDEPQTAPASAPVEGSSDDDRAAQEDRHQAEQKKRDDRPFFFDDPMV